MTNPVNAGLNLGFGALTRGIDAKVRRNSDARGTAGDRAADVALRRSLLHAIQAQPDIPLSSLETAVGDDPFRKAVLPNRLAEAQREGLIVVDSLTSTDPRWRITDLGMQRLGDPPYA